MSQQSLRVAPYVSSPHTTQTFTILTKFHNLDQVSQFRPSFTILTKFHNLSQVLHFRPSFTISAKLDNFGQVSRILQVQAVKTIETIQTTKTDFHLFETTMKYRAFSCIGPELGCLWWFSQKMLLTNRTRSLECPFRLLLSQIIQLSWTECAVPPKPSKCLTQALCCPASPALLHSGCCWWLAGPVLAGRRPALGSTAHLSSDATPPPCCTATLRLCHWIRLFPVFCQVLLESVAHSRLYA